MCAPAFARRSLRIRCGSYFDAGLLVTLNSDDPAFFGSDSPTSICLPTLEQAFTREELRQLAANSIRASFLARFGKSTLAFPN